MIFQHITFLKKRHRATGALFVARGNENFEYFNVFCCPDTSIFRNLSKNLTFSRNFYNIFPFLEILMSREIANSRLQHPSCNFTAKRGAKTANLKLTKSQILCILIPQAIAHSCMISLQKSLRKLLLITLS